MKTPEQLAEERYQLEPGSSVTGMGIVYRQREAFVAGLKEGPSVEDIKKAVEEVLDEHGLEIDGNANVELHRDLVARLSALFTQTQVEPNELLEAGNALFAAMRRYEMDVDEEPPYKHREMMARWEKAAQGIAGSSPQRSEDYSGEPGPTKEDAPKAPLVEQSEDAALPDGRWIPVSERLPEFDEIVMWYQSGSGSIFIEDIGHDDTWENFQKVRSRDLFGGPDDMSDPITHWMPLPEPPTP